MMCGRFALYSDPNKIAEIFSASLKYDIELSYNIAPSLTIPALVSVNHERMIVPLRWGLIPAWYKEGGKLALLNNAKGETIDIKPSFRTPFRQRRCLILADGFYEWDAKQKPKQPYYIQMKNHQPFAMAGIWDRWVSGEKSVESCCIITKAADEAVSPIHDRMPVILTPDKYDSWLATESHDVNQLKQLMENTVSAQNLSTFRVSTNVNKASFQGPECIKQI